MDLMSPWKSRGSIPLVSVWLVLLGSCTPRPTHHAALPPPTTQSIAVATASGLSKPFDDPALAAMVVPPLGWKEQPFKQDQKHAHRIWLSPSGDTAYGVIYFHLPLPLGADLTLPGFIDQMKQTEGDANLVTSRDDRKLPGVRFVADGGLYRIRGNLITSGFDGWVVYAGTLLKRPVNGRELSLCIAAREQTQVAD